MVEKMNRISPLEGMAGTAGMGQMKINKNKKRKKNDETNNNNDDNGNNNNTKSGRLVAE